MSKNTSQSVSMPLADESSTCGRWIFSVGLWVVVVAAFCLLLKYDVDLMRWRYQVLPEGAKGFFRQIVRSLREFGQIPVIVVSLIIVARMDKRRRGTIIAAVIIAQILASITYNVGKLTIARHRPNNQIEKYEDLEGKRSADFWIGWRPLNEDSKTQSFPSGHSGAAFALAGVLAWFYPPLRGLFWFLAGGCAVSRFLDAVHWPSDCLAGAVIGYCSAWLALRLLKQNKPTCPTLPQETN